MHVTVHRARASCLQRNLTVNRSVALCHAAFHGSVQDSSLGLTGYLLSRLTTNLTALFLTNTSTLSSILGI